MKLKDALRTLFLYGLPGFEINIRIYRNPVDFRAGEAPCRVENKLDHCPTMYEDNNVEQILFDHTSKEVTFYLTENDEDW